MEGPLKGHVGLLSIAFAGAAFPSKANVGIFNTATGHGRAILIGQVSLAVKKGMPCSVKPSNLEHKIAYNDYTITSTVKTKLSILCQYCAYWVPHHCFWCMINCCRDHASTSWMHRHVKRGMCLTWQAESEEHNSLIYCLSLSLSLTLETHKHLISAVLACVAPHADYSVLECFSQSDFWGIGHQECHNVFSKISETGSCQRNPTVGF